MASTSRGNNKDNGGSNNTAGFPRLSIRALLLSGSFHRKPKNRQTPCVPSTHSKLIIFASSMA